MIIIKRITNILFFILLFTILIFLLQELNVISFFVNGLKVLIPIFIGLFISVTMEGVISRFVAKGYSRKKVVIITYIIVILLIIGTLLLLVPKLIGQITIFIDTLPLLISNIENLFSRINININELTEFTSVKFEKIINYLSESFKLIFNIGIAISSAFFISYDYDVIKDKIKNMIPNIIKKEVIYFFSSYLPFFSKYIYSLMLDSIITFSLSFVLLWLFKVDYVLIGASIITITNLIPYIGTILATIPLFVIGYSISSYFAIVSIVIVLVVQIVESNIVQPVIFKNVIRIHPIEGIVGVLVFSYLFSFIGMIFAPLLIVAFKLLFIEKYKDESQFQSESIQ